MSKHDLKPPGTFFENLHAALDSQVFVFLDFWHGRATKLGRLHGNPNNNNKNYESLKVPELYFVERPCKAKWIERKKKRGGGALKRPATLCMFLLQVVWLPFFFELLLKVSHFFLSIQFGCSGSQKLHFGDHGLA